MKIIIVQPSFDKLSETFLTAQVNGLEHSTLVTLDGGLPAIYPARLAAHGANRRLGERLSAIISRRDFDRRRSAEFERILAAEKPNVVLAQYGPTGDWVAPACTRRQIPLVVHFHGHDASEKPLLARHLNGYRAMFEIASAIVVVSRAMRQAICALGCPVEKVVLSPYGVCSKRFSGAKPGSSAVQFLAVGRMVEKKGPHLSLLAFSQLLQKRSDATLLMVGDGPLLGVCKDLAAGLRLGGSVDFLGSQPREMIAEQMERARAFVQHSVVASNGDCEGTPVAVLEASSAGLPVIATRHAGIADAVVHGETGWLVDERDVNEMADMMLLAANEPELCKRLGDAGRDRATRYFSSEKSVDRLFRILGAAAFGESLRGLQDEILDELPDSYRFELSNVSSV